MVTQMDGLFFQKKRNFHVSLLLQALECIKTALVDPWVRTGMRLNLVQRAKRICCAGKNKHLLHLLSEFEVEHLEENREVWCRKYSRPYLSLFFPALFLHQIGSLL